MNDSDPVSVDGWGPELLQDDQDLLADQAAASGLFVNTGAPFNNGRRILLERLRDLLATPTEPVNGTLAVKEDAHPERQWRRVTYTFSAGGVRQMAYEITEDFEKGRRYIQKMDIMPFQNPVFATLVLKAALEKHGITAGDIEAELNKGVL